MHPEIQVQRETCTAVVVEAVVQRKFLRFKLWGSWLALGISWLGALLVFLPSGFQPFFPDFHEIICQFCALFVLLPAGEGLIVEPFIPLIASSQGFTFLYKHSDCCSLRNSYQELLYQV